MFVLTIQPALFRFRVPSTHHALALLLVTITLQACVADPSNECGAAEDPRTCRRSGVPGEPTPKDVSLLQVSSSEILKSSAASTDPSGFSPDCCKAAYCLAYGDPHFVTFDGKTSKGFQDQRTFWLVKSDSVELQGFADTSKGLMAGVSAGGDYLQGHHLMLRLGPTDEVIVTWDGEQILTKPTDQYHILGLVDLRRGNKLATEEHLKDLGGNHALKMSAKEINFQSDYFHFTLPGNIQLFASKEGFPKGSTSLAVMVKLATCSTESRAGGVMSGWCGNFNEDPEDDGDGPPVEDDEDLFKAGFSAAEMKAEHSTKLKSDNSSREKPCIGERLAMAQNACEIIKEHTIHEMCVFDVCVTGNASAAIDSLDAEVLEVEDGRGIPEFVGKGRCLDSEEQLYTTYEKAAINTAIGCKNALRELAAVDGVRGAQFQGRACQILVEHGSQNILTFEKVSDDRGTLIVDSVDDQTDYICWKLN